MSHLSIEALAIGQQPAVRVNWKTCCWLLLLSALTLPTTTFSLDWHSGEGFRSAPLKLPATGKTGFALLPEPVTGIAFTNHLADAKAAENQIRLNGSGVALGDVDGDGWCDIYFCGLEGPNVLFHNLGNWRFEDITATAGVACPNQFSTGAVFADVDGDGDLDLLVNAIGGGTRLFRNGGQGHFTESLDSGLTRKNGSMSMALADIDGDGDLDLYVANYRTTTVRSTGLDVLNVNGKRMLKPEDRDSYEYTSQGALLEHGEVDVLYLNDGKGHFRPVPWTSGNFLDEDGKPLTKPPKDWGLSVQFRDLNGDGAPDLYVCNDFWSPDRIWINAGKGLFRAIDRLALRHTTTFSMGVDFADINRDGHVDLLVLDMLSRSHKLRMTQWKDTGQSDAAANLIEGRPQIDHNTLQLNRGDGTFAEIAQLSGLHASEWAWSPVFLDVDLDGFEDLLITTGHGFDTQDLDAEDRFRALGPQPKEKIPLKLLMYPRLPLAKLAFRNRGDLTFEESGAAWGFNQMGVSHGIALADLDNDGDLDVVVNNLNGAAGIYRNETITPRIAVRLKGQPPNTRGIGAKIKVTGGPVTQSQEIICGGRYLSGDDAMRMFSAGSLTNRLNIEVTWRSGNRSELKEVLPNHVYEIAEASATAAPTAQPLTINHQPFFRDVSHLLNHVHHDATFDDFARQSLLPNKLSQLGPGVSWFDVDGDGKDDLIFGSGKGGQLAVYRNDGRGGFARLESAPFNQLVTRDQTTILGWQKADGHTVLLAGSANYEDGLTNGAIVREYNLSSQRLENSFPGQVSSTGPLALADIDGDGDLDLFVGGRVVAGKYPAPGSSLLFRSEGGKFQLDRENNTLLQAVGLVSGAAFSDLDGDGFPDLMLACEWGPVRVFHNERGKLSAWNAAVSLNSQPSTLNSLAGWWNGVTTGDFDGDGRLDIVASNWGRNCKYQSYLAQPLRIYYGDLGGAGATALVEAHFDPELRKVVPWRGLVIAGMAMPWVRARFGTHRAYASAGVEEIFGERLKGLNEIKVNTLDSMVFLNRGDHFEARALPIEAQMAPAFAVCVGDFDGDGFEDIFLSQNFFATQPETSRYDAGRGLWLSGDGKGGFTAVPGQASGVKVYGEQRGAALCDYDADGRVDLAVTQNGAATKLYRNETGKPGLRVKLVGPPDNPQGVGAVVKLKYGDRFGPAREVHAGSGYWSQDSALQVMAMPAPPTKVWVRWPGGRVVEADMPAGALEVSVDGLGQVKLIR